MKNISLRNLSCFFPLKLFLVGGTLKILSQAFNVRFTINWIEFIWTRAIWQTFCNFNYENMLEKNKLLHSIPFTSSSFLSSNLFFTTLCKSSLREITSSGRVDLLIALWELWGHNPNRRLQCLSACCWQSDMNS